MKKSRFSGWHLMVDALVADGAVLRDTGALREFFLGLVSFLDMKLLDGPNFTDVELDPSRLESESDEGGVTGYCLITTSHISIHTWPLRSRFCLDIFSCKQFDPDLVVSEIRRALGVSDVSVTWIERRWPVDSPLPVEN